MRKLEEMAKERKKNKNIYIGLSYAVPISSGSPAVPKEDRTHSFSLAGANSLYEFSVKPS